MEKVVHETWLRAFNLPRSKSFEKKIHALKFFIKRLGTQMRLFECRISTCARLKKFYDHKKFFTRYKEDYRITNELFLVKNCIFPPRVPAFLYRHRTLRDAALIPSRKHMLTKFSRKFAESLLLCEGARYRRKKIGVILMRR